MLNLNFRTRCPQAARSAAVVAAACLSAVVLASPQRAHAAIKTVDFTYDFPMGAIVIVNKTRRLYYVLGNGKAVRYPVAVGERNEIWRGKIFVQSKRKYPTWTSPETGRTVAGGAGNPLGVRALYLGWTLWRIHGTSKSGSIGRAVSNGCIRMHNKDVTDLYDRVHLGAPVYVIGSFAEASQPLGPAKKLVDR